jgi:hypothetical protein
LGKSFPRARILAALLVVAACGGRAKEPPPVAALASTREAQDAIRPLRQRWMSAGPTDRARLEPDLRKFLAAFPKDGLVPLVRAELALCLLAQSDVEGAREAVRPVLSGSTGSVRDLAEIVEGAILLRKGQPALAFERLLPLVGKIIDPQARILFDEEIVQAAIGSGRWYEAVAYMDVWLRDAQDEDRDAVRGNVERALAAIPSEALELTLKAMDRGAGYGPAIRRAVVDTLASVALKEKDPDLARRLVEAKGPAPVASDVVEGLEDLASSGAGAVADGRTIGFLLSTGAGPTGARSAEVLSGAIDALRARSGSSAEDATRIISREERDPARTELALGALASQGAVLLVAGLDAEEADAADRFAARTGTPTILLYPSHKTPHGASAYALGEPEGTECPALESALRDRGARRIVTVGPGAVPCDIAPVQAGEPRFPVKAWKQAHTDGLVLSGDSACTRDVLTDVAGGGPAGVRIATGLLGAGIAADEPGASLLLVASAGVFPLSQGASASPLDAYKKRHGIAPSWSVALGHDATVLARLAVTGLPLDRTEDAAKVKALHERVRAALAAAEAPLWTTEARRFGADRAMPRTIAVREIKR